MNKMPFPLVSVQILLSLMPKSRPVLIPAEILATVTSCGNGLHKLTGPSSR